MMLSFLCVAISFLWIKYSESKRSTLQVPLIIAFNLGRKNTQEGIAVLSGKILNILLWRITTTANTKIDTPSINRETDLSFIVIVFRSTVFYISQLFGDKNPDLINK